MENHNDKEGFSFTYSAKQMDEIKNIRDKYLPKEADKMEQLRQLDKSVTQKGTIVSLIVGVLGTLIMGAGMSLALVWTEDWLILGIVVGIVGMVVLSIAYPLYNSITKKERQKIAPEIMRLTDELMK